MPPRPSRDGRCDRRTGSVALAGFGVDSAIEIIASAVVVWQLKGTVGDGREQIALRTIAVAFALLTIRSRR